MTIPAVNTLHATTEDVEPIDFDSMVFDWPAPPTPPEPEVEKASLSDQFRASPLHHARAWVQAGWNVIPIHPDSKAPLLKFKRFFGPSGDRVTERDLAIWFLWQYKLDGRVPNYAVLLDSGPFPLVALDLDHADVFDWGSATFGTTPYTVASGREGGGRHGYFRGAPGSVQRQSIGRMGPDVHVAWEWQIDAPSKSLVLAPKWGITKADIKSACSYVIGAGSMHQSGRPYTASDTVSLELLKTLPVWDPVLYATLVAEHSARKAEHLKTARAALEKAYPRPDGLSPEQGEHVQRLVALSRKEVKPGKQDALNLKVLDACPLTLWARANAEGLTYPIRQVLASNVAKLAGEDGKDTFLGILSKHSRYDATESAAIWSKAMEWLDAAPMTYRYAHEHGGWPGPLPDRPKSPAALVYGVVDADPEAIITAAQMTRYTFIASQNKIYDAELREFYSCEAFGQLGAEFRLWLSRGFDSVRQQAKTITFCTDGSHHPEAYNSFDRSCMPSPKSSGPSPPPDGLGRLVMNLANRDAKQAQYILEWLAFRVRFPHLPQVALVLSGPEGTGKGLFSKAARAVCAPYTTTANQVAIESDWNDHLQNSILVIANEISADSMRDKRKVSNALLEQVLAGEKVMINPKGGKKFEIKVSAGWVICTNHDLAICLGETDRRYSIIRGDGILLAQPDGRAYIDTMVDNLNDRVWTQQLVDFLYSLPLDQFDFRTPLKNDAHERALGASRTPMAAWWAQVMSADGDVPAGTYPTSWLWKRFCAWATASGERDAYSLTGFSRKVPEGLVRSKPSRSKLAKYLVLNEPTKASQLHCVTIEDYGQTGEIIPGWDEDLKMN